LKQIELVEELARGGVGLVITGIAYVHASGRISPVQNSLADDDCIPGFRKLAAAAHEHGAGLAVQLFHGGREVARVYKSGRRQALAPSVVPDDPYFQEPCRAMSEEEILEVIRAFGEAAGRAREAGVDAVQVHGAHAYLLSQFLSPFTNRRTDAWGGDLKNRLRLHHEIYRAIRARVGEDYPVLIKIGVQDGFSGGLEFQEGKQAALGHDQWGYDALEISSGLRGSGYEQAEFRTKINRLDREGYFRNWCKEIKFEVAVPVMMVGGLRTFGLMEEIIRNGEADFISLCRPLIREPQLIKAWQNNDRHRAACVSCNKCFEVLLEGKPLHCACRERA
jgi:2,4-dienoyl-CoA reductase-like NADH-dependent reductase (Old Yellow Enzyme family)